MKRPRLSVLSSSSRLLSSPCSQMLSADRRVPHGDVMEIVDLLKGAKVKRFAMTTEVKAQE